MAHTDPPPFLESATTKQTRYMICLCYFNNLPGLVMFACLCYVVLESISIFGRLTLILCRFRWKFETASSKSWKMWNFDWNYLIFAVFRSFLIKLETKTKSASFTFFIFQYFWNAGHSDSFCMKNYQGKSFNQFTAKVGLFQIDLCSLKGRKTPRILDKNDGCVIRNVELWL